MWACLARAAVRGLDARLRRAQGVYEFSAEPECLLRVAIGRCGRDLRLGDGTAIARGERVGELHLWNERLPSMDASGADFRWATAMRRGMAASLRLLAAHIRDHADWDGIRAFRGETALDPHWGGWAGASVLGRLGLELLPPEPDSWPRPFTDFWENLYTWWLIWTFAPASLRSKRFWRIRRRQVWISRHRLLASTGDGSAVRTALAARSEVEQIQYR